MTLEDLIGEWELEIGGVVGGRAEFTWELGGAYVVQRQEPFEQGPPKALMVIEPAGDAYRQHYFDSRGVTRVYAMELSGDTWTLTRTEPDFTELSFRQRFVGTLRGDVIEGRWETGADDGGWELDFELTYRRR
jgi:hypothetical protein